jgi:hypothetical protein
MTKKIYNVVLNSSSALNASTFAYNNLNYYVDWSAILKPDKSYKVTWSYMGSMNYVNGFDFPILTINWNQLNYTTGITGASTTQIIGTLRENMINQNAYIGNFYAGVCDNPPLYLESMPYNNNINVSMYSNVDGALYLDNFFTPAGTGQATQAGNILTVTTATTGIITLGTIITISSIPRVVIGFGTGTGGTGTYYVSISATVAVATAYTFPTINGSPNSPYVLTLSFEEQ